MKFYIIGGGALYVEIMGELYWLDFRWTNVRLTKMTDTNTEWAKKAAIDMDLLASKVQILVDKKLIADPYAWKAKPNSTNKVLKVCKYRDVTHMDEYHVD